MNVIHRNSITHGWTNIDHCTASMTTHELHICEPLSRDFNFQTRCVKCYGLQWRFQNYYIETQCPLLRPLNVTSFWHLYRKILPWWVACRVSSSDFRHQTEAVLQLNEFSSLKTSRLWKASKMKRQNVKTFWFHHNLIFKLHNVAILNIM